jgi:CSLREA domain-containing protein
MLNDRRQLVSRVLTFALAVVAADVEPARSAIYTVTTLADNVTVDAQCSLREAVAAHNAASGSNDCGSFDAAADTIDFSVTGTILLNSALGEIFVTAPALSLDGPGAALVAIDGQDAMSILFLDQTLTVPLTVRRLTLQNGAARDIGPSCSSGGGAIHGNGCGFRFDDLTIEDSVFQDNTARNPIGAGSGGAILAAGIVRVTRSRFLRNDAHDIGAIRMGFGTLHVTESTFEDNIGGTIGFFNGFPTQSTIRSSLFRRNTAQATPLSGAGSAAIGTAFGSTLIENCTFQGNDADPGGAVVAARTVAPTELIVRNSTFADNAIQPGGAVVLVGSEPTSTLALTSSLFANNTGPAVAVTDGATATSRFNLFDTTAATLPAGTVCAGSTAGGANLCGVAAPGLDPLAANGGLTQTMALQPVSPAVHAGANPGGLTTDQRGSGFPRTQGPGTDIGAFETALVPVELLDFTIEQ